MIFIDRSIPEPVATALRQRLNRTDVVWLDEVFRQDTPDVVWLREVGRRGWMVISRDKKIRTRPGERQELLDAGVGCFILASKKDMTKADMTTLIENCLSRMECIFNLEPRPFIYTISGTGDFRRYA